MAMDMFMNMGVIKGETKDKAKAPAGEIDVLAWSWGQSNSGTMHVGGGGGAGKVNVQDLSFTKYIDKASPTLMQYCSKGTHLPKAILTVRKAGGTPLEYLVVTMEEVLVSSISTGGSGGEDRLTENVSLNFAKVNVDYQEQDEKGAKKGGPVNYKYNIATNA